MRMLLAAVYVGAMVAANLLVWLSPWFVLIDSVLLIGLDLTLRDVLDERLTRAQLAAVIVGGGAIIWLANPEANHIAIASAAAFILAALADWLAYSRLRSHPWMVRCNGSNVVGAAVDSVIFPLLAFGVFPPAAISLQFAAKVGGGAIWSVLLRPLVRPGVSARRRAIEGLQVVPTADAEAGDHRAAKAPRDLIERLTSRAPTRGRAASTSSSPAGSTPSSAMLHPPNGVRGKAVAGAGIEPATYGL